MAAPLSRKNKRKSPFHKGHSGSRQGGGKARIGLNLTAMIDVVFLLLLYFMLATSFADREENFQLDLPDPRASAAADPFRLEDPPINIMVQSRGPAESDFIITTDEPALGNVAGSSDLYQRLTAGRFDRGGYLFSETQVFIIKPLHGTRWEHALEVFNVVVRAGFDSVYFAPPDGGTG